jgi:hypothetical protein
MVSFVLRFVDLGGDVRQPAASEIADLCSGNLTSGVARATTSALRRAASRLVQSLVSGVSLTALDVLVFHGCLFRFVDVMTMHPVFPLGNTYFSHTTATARSATASSAKRILADGERSPFRMRETVLF